MNPPMLSSAEMPSLEFVQNLAETLLEYGVDEDEVYGLPPSLINYISYLISIGEELEEDILELQGRHDLQAKDLRRIRTQRNGLLSKAERLAGD